MSDKQELWREINPVKISLQITVFQTTNKSFDKDKYLLYNGGKILSISISTRYVREQL